MFRTSMLLFLIFGGAVATADSESKMLRAMEERLTAEFEKKLVKLRESFEAELQVVKDQLQDALALANDSRKLAQDERRLFEGRILTVESKTQCIGPKSDDKELYFVGCNVHIRNDKGKTRSANGKGNLIVGYNERADCRENCRRTGSHNVIIGPSHDWRAWGGLAVGKEHFLLQSWAAISGGAHNSARRTGSSISGGFNNNANGLYSSILGGQKNSIAGVGEVATIAGGFDNLVTGRWAHISGGESNIARGRYSSILGSDDIVTTDKHEIFPEDDDDV